MRIEFDRTRCAGHARCNVLAPDVYPLDDAGYNAVEDMAVPAELQEQAVAGARTCPEQAISLVT